MRPGVTRRAVNEKTIYENRGETHSDKKKKLLVCRYILCCPDKQFTSVGCVTQLCGTVHQAAPLSNAKAMIGRAFYPVVTVTHTGGSRGPVHRHTA